MKGHDIYRRAVVNYSRMELEVISLIRALTQIYALKFLHLLYKPAYCHMFIQAKRKAKHQVPHCGCQVEYTKDSRDSLLHTGKVNNQKGKGSVVGMLQGAAKGFFQQMRVARPHNHFL